MIAFTKIKNNGETEIGIVANLYTVAHLSLLGQINLIRPNIFKPN